MFLHEKREREHEHDDHRRAVGESQERSSNSPHNNRLQGIWHFFGPLPSAKFDVRRKLLHAQLLTAVPQKQRRERDSNPRYRFKPVHRFSKPAPSAARPSLQRSLRLSAAGGRVNTSRAFGAHSPPAAASKTRASHYKSAAFDPLQVGCFVPPSLAGQQIVPSLHSTSRFPTLRSFL